MLKFKLLSTFILIGLLFISCNDETPKAHINQKDSTKAKEPPMSCDTFIVIKYNKICIKSSSELERIRKEYNFADPTSASHRAITTLNRKEFRFFGVKDSILIPEMVNPDLRAYSVFPECYPSAREIKKLILISNKYQCYACYEYGKLVKFSAGNTGKERTQTYPGRYALNWRQRLRKSSLDSNWILPYTWNFHLQAGNAFHQFEMPGRPVSHSCVRQFMEDAKWLYSWGEGTQYDSLKKPIYMSGTPVIIIDFFDFNNRKYKPWMHLSSNRDIKLSLPDKPLEVEEALIPISQIPTDARGSLRNRDRYEKAEEILRSRGVIRQNVTIIETRNFNKERRLKKEKEEREKKAKDSTVTN